MNQNKANYLFLILMIIFTQLIKAQDKQNAIQGGEEPDEILYSENVSKNINSISLNQFNSIKINDVYLHDLVVWDESTNNIVNLFNGNIKHELAGSDPYLSRGVMLNDYTQIMYDGQDGNDILHINKLKLGKQSSIALPFISGTNTFKISDSVIPILQGQFRVNNYLQQSKERIISFNCDQFDFILSFYYNENDKTITRVILISSI